MKKLIFLFIIFSCLILVGCGTTVDMEYGIDADNNAYTRLRIDIKAGDLLGIDKSTLQNNLIDITAYYRDELGFDAETDYFAEDESNAYIILKKTVPSKSFDEAFENLKAMLCDEELTAFSKLSCEISDTEGSYAYRIDGRVDLHRALENSYNSGIGKGIAEYVKKQLEDSSFSLTFSMPDNTKVYRLSLTEPSEISFSGKATAKSDILPYPLSGLNNTMLDVTAITVIVITLLSVLGITFGVKLIKNGKKKDNDTL